MIYSAGSRGTVYVLKCVIVSNGTCEALDAFCIGVNVFDCMYR